MRLLPSLAALLVCGVLRAPAGEPVTAAPPEVVSATVTNFWFPVGEELVYHAHWGVFYVAESRTTVNWTHHEGRALLAVRIRTKSNAVISTVYPVDDTVETLIDPATFLPVRFSKILNEGRYHTDEVTVFDHAAGKAYWHNRKKNERKEFAIDPDTRDIVTLMYWLRRESFKPGQTREFRVMADEKLYDLFVRVKDREELDNDTYGTLPTVRIEPDAAFQGLFVRKGKLTLWVSEDERRILTRVVAVIPVANVRIHLDRVLGPGNDRWVKNKGGT